MRYAVLELSLRIYNGRRIAYRSWSGKQYGAVWVSIPLRMKTTQGFGRSNNEVKIDVSKVTKSVA